MYNTLKHLFYHTSKHPLNTPYTPYIHHCIHHYIHQARRPIAMRSAVPPPVPSMDEFEGKLNDAMDALWDTAESRQTEAEARLVGYRQSLLSDPRLGAMDRAFSKIIEQEAEDGRHLIATVRTFLKQVDPPSSAPSSPPSPPPSPPPSSPPSSPPSFPPSSPPLLNVLFGRRESLLHLLRRLAELRHGAGEVLHVRFTLTLRRLVVVLLKENPKRQGF